MIVIVITDQDIEKIEYKLGITFDDESKEFIKCLESKDIQACPGAGKTTSLVAKLGILSQYMPFEDNSGVLVLTHTNVAVDEIKEKLGIDAHRLLRYPNHIGTFQSFINKYLAIPMYIHLTGKRPERIDDEHFYDLFRKKFDKVNKFHRNWIQQRADEKYIDVLRFIDALEPKDDSLQYNGKNIITSKSTMFTAIKTISKIPHNLRKDGYLTYQDCYELALKYLDDFPTISEIFQKRFKYIFIDEAQDTDDGQFEILNRLFPESIVQRIGDNNQAIFSFSGQKSSGWSIVDDYIEIKNTKRLSSLIANQVQKVAVEPQLLNGNDAIEISPIIILFDNPENVLPKFAELIVEYGLHEYRHKTFKAIGGVAKHNDNGDTLPSYYPAYSRSSNRSLDYDNLVEKIENSSMENIRLNDYRSIVLDIVVKYLKEKNISTPYVNNKNFTKNSMLAFLRENSEKIYNDFKLKLYEITQKLSNLECVKDDVKDLLESFLTLIGETIDSDILDTVIKEYEVKAKTMLNTNVYKHEDGEINFDIEISTIHGVKGETHTATLVLETFKDGYDLFQLLDYLKNKTNKLKLDNKKKLAYVAMSRPTHLLCLAIHKSHMHRKKIKEVTDADIEVLKECGFRIVT